MGRMFVLFVNNKGFVGEAGSGNLIHSRILI